MALFDILNMNPAESVTPAPQQGLLGITGSLAQGISRGIRQATGQDIRTEQQRLNAATRGADTSTPEGLLALATRLDGVGMSSKAIVVRQAAAEAAAKEKEQESIAEGNKALSDALMDIGQNELASLVLTGRPEFIEVGLEILGREPKEGDALTANQWQAATFAVRMGSANDTLKTYGAQFAAPSSRFSGLALNEWRSDDRQLFDQAERNFINATLRRESGSEIKSEEFDNARQQYIPLPGDSTAVLEAKRLNREQVYTGLRLEGGDAYTQLVGSLVDTYTAEQAEQTNPEPTSASFNNAVFLSPREQAAALLSPGARTSMYNGITNERQGN